MGDRIHGNQFVINRSPNARVTFSPTGLDPRLERALEAIQAHVAERQHAPSEVLLQGLLKELQSAKTKRSPGPLRALWNALVQGLPDAARVASAVETVSKLLLL